MSTTGFVAICDYNGRDEFGTPLAIKAGRTIVSSDWWGLRVPAIAECFARQGRPAERRSGAIIRTHSGATLHFGEPTEDVEVVTAGPPVVNMTRRAWRQIREAIGWSGGGIETGGPCFGYVDQFDNVVVVEAFGPPLHTALTGTRTQFRFSNARALELERSFEPEGWVWVADWHTHPGARIPKPSPTDLRGWRGLLRSDVGSYAGLIVPEIDEMNIGAWVVTTDARDPRPTKIKWQVS